MASKRDTEPVGKVADSVVTTLIGCHGLLVAYEIAKRIQEQMMAQVKSQIRRHPDEWDAGTKRELGFAATPPVPEVP